MKKDIEEIVRGLGRIQCTIREVAAVLRISDKTVKSKYFALLEEGREEGKVSLRRKQFEKALEGNITMLIWLGRNYLEQKEEYKVASTFEPEARALFRQFENAAMSLLNKEEAKKDDSDDPFGN